MGDVDSNGTVDMKDILMLRKKVAGQQVDMTKYNPLAADVNIDKAGVWFINVANKDGAKPEYSHSDIYWRGALL